MTVTLAYDQQLSRVRINADSLGAALFAQVERSTNEITWTAVRGGVDVAVTAGVMSAVDDYEFSADVSNFYRVRYFAEPSFVSVGTADTGDNASVSPGLPAGHAVGDTLLMFAAIRNYGLGTVDVPAGWTELVSMNGNAKLFGKPSTGVAEVAPTVSFTNGTAGSDTAAQICALRNVNMSSLISASDAEAGQDILTPAFDLASTWHGAEVLYLGWKADDWTSVALAQGTEVAEIVMTAGNDMGMVWNHRSIPESVFFDELGAQTFTVTGGGVATAQGGVVAMEPTTLTQADSITPSLGGAVWLKFMAHPFLNTRIRPIGHPNATRRSRGAEFDVVGRSNAVGLHDKRGGREFELPVLTESEQDYERLDLILAGGDPVFLHTPPGSPWPTLYAAVGDVSDEQPIPHTHFTTLPMKEVVAPSAEIVGATATFQTLLNAHTTFSDVLSTYSTFQDLLELIAQPGDIVVP